METIKSPLTGMMNVQHIGIIETYILKDKYLRFFNIPIDHLIGHLSKIDVYVCRDTGYRFYHPFNVSGDGKFYELLEEFDWYYMPWKWEHIQALRFVKPGMKVLEVGCGQGGFIEGVMNRVEAVSVIGLELNENAIEICREKRLNVFSESVQNYSFKNREAFDLVCSFQVLEHISEVRTFIDANVNLVKTGGYLIYAVPNNDSFAKYDRENDILNMPPHHMGCWTPKSLKSLEKLYPLKLISFKKEPLQAYHIDWFLNNTDIRIKKISPRLYFYYKKFKLRNKLEKFARKFPNLFDGHTQFVTFKKK